VRGKSLNDATMTVVRSGRLAFAAFGIAAVVQAVVDSTGSLVNFFSYFTIESNLMAIVVLLVGGVADPRSPRWAWIRGAVTLYIVVTGIVYAALLANAEVGLTAEWVNSAMHQVIPAVLLLDWLCFPPWPSRAEGGKARPELAWLAFPLLYLAYSLGRGAAVDWYPYPFLDPLHPGGYGRVAIYCVVLAAVMALLALGVAAAGRWRAARLSGDRSPRPQVSAPGR
jgi:carbon starvation protein CstA